MHRIMDIVRSCNKRDTRKINDCGLRYGETHRRRRLRCGNKTYSNKGEMLE